MIYNCDRDPRGRLSDIVGRLRAREATEWGRARVLNAAGTNLPEREGAIRYAQRLHDRAGRWQAERIRLARF